MDKKVFYGNVIDGTGAPMIEHGMVVVEGDKIEYVGKEVENYQLPQDVKVYDYRDHYIMPGLIESHVHLSGYASNNTLDWVTKPIELKICQAIHDLEALLDAGYTSVRDVGGYGAILRRAMNEGVIRGPRIMSALQTISPSAGHSDVYTDFTREQMAANAGNGCFWQCDGVDECIKAARKQFRHGADFIKIQTSGGIMDTSSGPAVSYYNQDEIEAFVREAERMNTYVATHAENDPGVYNAVIAGVKCIEHGFYASEKTIQAMLDHGCWHVPTLSVMRVLMAHADTMIPLVREKVKRILPGAYESLINSYKAGVPMAAGADFLSVKGQSEYGGDNCMELEEFVKVLGASPLQAISCCTKNGAMLMLRDDIGTLEVNKLADLIVVEDNPLEKIESLQNTKKTKLVMKEGKVEKHIA